MAPSNFRLPSYQLSHPRGRRAFSSPAFQQKSWVQLLLARVGSCAHLRIHHCGQETNALIGGASQLYAHLVQVPLLESRV